jgi:putative ABC transport system permease protein
MGQISNIQRLALSDYRHEWRMSSCFVLALAAVLAPMMVLFGLKFGIVTRMIDDLVQDPAKREIRPVGSERFTAQWLARVAEWPGVEFIVPRTRTLAATLDLYNADAGRIVKVELIPTAPGDPLLEGLTAQPKGYREIILSAAAARKLQVSPGETLEASLARRFRGERERGRLRLGVAAVAGPSAFPRDGAFVSVDLLLAAEAFRDGRAVPALGWDGDPPPEADRVFPAYRLYARSIDDVAGLRDRLEAQGLEVRTAAAEIELVRTLDRNLSVIFWIVALVGMSGFVLSLGASLWANVERKRRELSVLRLMGFRTADIIWFPLLQSLATGILGWLAASLLYLLLAHGINGLFPGERLCRLLPGHFLAALGLTLTAAVLAAGLGGFRAARLEPAEGIREI